MLLPPTAPVDAVVAGLADGGWVLVPSKVLHPSHLVPEDFRGIGRLVQGADFGSVSKPSAAVGMAPLGTRQRGLLGRWWFFCRKYFSNAKF